MSFCRFGYDDSEAYCYATAGGYVVWLEGPEKFTFSSAKACAEFLTTCRKRGLSVPQYAIDGLLGEEEDE